MVNMQADKAICDQAQLLSELQSSAFAETEVVSKGIFSLCIYSDKVRQQVLQLGGLSSIVNLLTSPCLPASFRHSVAQALFDGPASSRAVAKQIRAQGGLHPVIVMLQSPAYVSQVTAAFALQIMCKHSSIVSRLLCKQGGLCPLIGMLHSSSAACQQQAAQTVHAFCLSNGMAPDERQLRSFEPQHELVKLGVLAPLCELLGSSSDGSQKAALKAIEAVCSNDSSISGSSLAVDQLKELGGLQLIVAILDSPSFDSKAAAANTIKGLCASNSLAAEQMVSLGVLQLLVKCLNTSDEASCQAAAALAVKSIYEAVDDHSTSKDGSSNHDDLQAHMPCALRRLVEMMRHASLDCQEAAASALASICQWSSAAKAHLATFSGLRPLILLLSSSSAACRANAAAAISVLCHSCFAIQQLVIGLQGATHLLENLCSSAQACRDEAAKALASMSNGNATIFQQVLQHLMTLLAAPSSCSCEAAARAIIALGSCGSSCSEVLLRCFIELGGLQALVGLLLSTSGTSQECIAEAIVKVCARASAMTHSGEQDSESAWNIPCLEDLLETTAGNSQVRVITATRALYSALQNSEEKLNDLQLLQPLVGLGIVQPLMNFITSPAAGCQQEAAAAVTAIIDHNIVTEGSSIVAQNIGGVQPFIQLLQCPQPLCQQSAAAAIYAFIGSPWDFDDDVKSSQWADLGSTSCLLALIDMLGSALPESQQRAAQALHRISGSREAGAHFVMLNGLHPLIHLLSLPCEKSQWYAAGAIWSLCAGPGNLTAHEVVRLGGWQPLVNLLSSSNEDCRDDAAYALWAICGVSDTTCQQVVDLGALQPLVDMLDDRYPSISLELISKLYSICSASQPQDILLDAVQPLVDLLMEAPSVYTDRLGYVAETLGHVCSGSAKAKQELARLGGLSALVNVLSSTSLQAQARSALAIGMLCDEDKDAQDQMMGLHCLQLLVGLLTPGKEQEISTMKYHLEWESRQRCQLEAAQAISNICKGNAEAVKQVTALDGLTPLVSLLTSTSAACQANAALALSSICNSLDQQSSVCSVQALLTELGTKQYLIKLQSSSQLTVRAAADTALKSLAVIQACR